MWERLILELQAQALLVPKCRPGFQVPSHGEGGTGCWKPRSEEKRAAAVGSRAEKSPEPGISRSLVGGVGFPLALGGNE